MYINVNTEDEKLFNKIYVANSKKVYMKILQLVKSEAVAEDLMQEVFGLLLRNFEELKEYPSLQGWLLKAASFYAYNYHKITERRGEVTISEEMEELLGINGITNEDLIDIEKILKDEEFELLKLKILGGYTFAELSVYYGIKEGACKMKFKRICEKIKKFLK